MSRKRYFSCKEYRGISIWRTLCSTEIYSKTFADRGFKIWFKSICTSGWMWSIKSVCIPWRTGSICNWTYYSTNAAYCSPKRENLGNLFMHLTNYAINKSNSKFEYNQSSDRMDVGHKRSLTSILNKLG